MMTAQQYKELQKRKGRQIEAAIRWAIIKKAYWNIVPPQPEKRKGCLLMLLLLIFISIISYIFIKN